MGDITNYVPELLQTTNTSLVWCMQPAGYPSLLYTDGSVLSSSYNLFYGVLNIIAESSTRDNTVQAFPNQYIHPWI
jgi:hypothetical protein